MAVMGHHGPLLLLHFAEQILMVVYVKHLQQKHIDWWLFIYGTFIK